MAWQLDRMKEMGVRSAVISYNHHADGTPNLGEPAVFSDAWWELVAWAAGECKERGMQIGFQDYTLLNPLLQKIGEETPGMSGGSLREVHVFLREGECCTLGVDEGCVALQAFAYRADADAAEPGSVIDLGPLLEGGHLKWTAPQGRWLVSLISIKPNPFDPMHASAGTAVIARFYRPLKIRLGEHLGTAFSISFQDELDFGSQMPMWSGRLAQEFLARKGYELGPVLSALWNDLGPRSAKVRIDYGDVVTELLEENYFIPVFEWHERHGLLFGNDNHGRGGIAVGRAHYGDAFRAMRWYSAPGTDDPKLDGERAFKGLKVFSSIAHLYRRPRVWCECFHSSGWGARPADLVAALNENFLYGATLVNLHGLYYSTYGSWWEWASPDFHFRQPYARHMKAFDAYVSRLSQTLSQGTHVCDVAIVYPVTAIEGGLNRLVVGDKVSYSEWQAGEGTATTDEAEALAFRLGRHLVSSGIDFDFIDFQSLERADIASGAVNVSGESYKILILAGMSAVRFSTLVAARDLVMAGGTVIAFGCLPVASERAGSGDPEVEALVRQIFGSETTGDGHSVCRNASGGLGVFVRESCAEVERVIGSAIVRDFDPAGSGVCALHRRNDSLDIYYLFNPRQDAVKAELSFRSTGAAERWDAWTGEQVGLDSESISDGVSRLELLMESGVSQIVVFDRTRQASGHEEKTAGNMGSDGCENLTLDGPWDFELVPTMDNRFGDFRLPADQPVIGAEARKFRYREDEGEMWTQPDLDDSDWPLVTASYGPRFWKLGPFPAGTDHEAVESALLALEAVDPSVPIRVGGHDYAWSPYEFSLRWGVENDPHLKDWASGPHGLKGEVPDEFIDLPAETPGAVWYFWTCVQTPDSRPLTFMMGSRCRYSAWLNGAPILDQTSELPPGRQSEWNLPHYKSEARRADVSLGSGNNPLLLKIREPEGQRLRAYAAFDLPREDSLALRWFTNPAHPEFNCRPDRTRHAGWYRFLAPPGLAALDIAAKGPVRAWIDGEELLPSHRETRDGGSLRCRFDILRPSRQTAIAALRVEQPASSFGGDSLPEPVLLECVPGEISLGDWSAYGLETYSGAAWYRRTIELSAEQSARAAELDLGQVAVTAEVHVNGHLAATLIAPPWRVCVGGLVHEGENEIAILVANTLANHYSGGIPTPYVFERQTVSGLLSPIHLRMKPSIRS